MPRRILDSLADFMVTPIQGTALARANGRLILGLATLLASLLLAFIGFLLFREDGPPLKNMLVVAGLVLVPGIATFAFLLVMATRLLSDGGKDDALIPNWLPSVFGGVVLFFAIFRVVIAFRGVPFGSILEAIFCMASAVMLLWLCFVAHRRGRGPSGR